mmetsp:Transcript_87953/g.210173  ORF Transcript_87953/g.210173 Transcript_87953/m.210173 type:complete len:213 (-) Transcript_87953:2400-3038(-)
MRWERPDISPTFFRPPSRSSTSSKALGGRLKCCASFTNWLFTSAAQASSSPFSPWVRKQLLMKCSTIMAGPERCSSITGSWKARLAPFRSRGRRVATRIFPTGLSLILLMCQPSSSARRKEAGPSKTLDTSTRSPKSSSFSSKVTGSLVSVAWAETTRRRRLAVRKTSWQGTPHFRSSSGRLMRLPSASTSLLSCATCLPPMVSLLRRVRLA